VRVDEPLRGPTNLAPPDRLESKFRDCAVKALEPGAVGRVYELLQSVETLGDVRQLTEVMAQAVKTRTPARAAA
jgi:hypothetical protein